MFYFVRTPAWLKKFYRSYIWEMEAGSKKIYLSFDDGPHPIATPFVLDELKRAGALATFFCLGKNVVKYPEIYKRIIEEGHAVGNHSFDHPNGWKTKNKTYLANIAEAKKYIDSDLFRPPYGKITRFQHKLLSGKTLNLRIVMWTVLSGDFDKAITPEQCYRNVINKTRDGSIVVFHDSEKAYEKMHYSLPLVLKYYIEKEYCFEKIKC